MIQIENLIKFYGEHPAVDGISFEIPLGQIVGFLGPNGAGKTTTMRMLTGYLTPTGGTAKILGLDVTENPIEIRQKIGYLPEMNPVYEDMIIPEYLEFVAGIRKLDKNKIKERIIEVAKLCGLTNVLHQNIGELSRGYKQRVGFAAAIFHDPQVLILDEPTSGLDPNQARDVRELIKELKKEKTVILSTHILSEVQAICDRVLIINRGRIVADGTTKELACMVQNKEKVHLELLNREEKLNPSEIEEKLKAFNGCENAAFTGQKENKITFEIESSIDLREDIFLAAVKNKWVITDMHRQVVTLEEIFRKLTSEAI
ncbi:MAG: hypothetical protein A3J83_03525 [Elusimicrobia bacterium RIFOXYA2_FULL_40_6]|nr:MAG: hypothetical protein A3J83_03525 [Elusimicrobia bacterium RIFOXYA2_FULL_40_6]